MTRSTTKVFCRNNIACLLSRAETGVHLRSFSNFVYSRIKSWLHITNMLQVEHLQPEAWAIFMSHNLPMFKARMPSTHFILSHLEQEMSDKWQ